MRDLGLLQENKSSSSYSSETSFDSGMSDNANASQSVFAAQSEEHLLMWDSVPWTAKEWSSAKERISLVRTRVLSTNDHQDNNGSHRGAIAKRSSSGLLGPQGGANSSQPRITLRHGEDRGIVCFVFQVGNTWLQLLGLMAVPVLLYIPWY